MPRKYRKKIKRKPYGFEREVSLTPVIVALYLAVFVVVVLLAVALYFYMSGVSDSPAVPAVAAETSVFESAGGTSAVSTYGEPESETPEVTQTAPDVTKALD